MARVLPFSRRVEARRATDRASRDIAVAITAHRSYARARLCPCCGGGAHWIQDIRRGRRRCWGGLLQFLDRAHAIGAPLSVLLLIPDVVASYIHDLFDTPPAPALRLVA